MTEVSTAPATTAPAGFRTTEYECAKGWPEQYKGVTLTRDFALTVEGAVQAGHFASADALLNAAYGQLKIKAGHAAQKAATESIGEGKTPLTNEEVLAIFRETNIGAPRARSEGKAKGPNAGVVKEAKEIKESLENALTQASVAELKMMLKFKIGGAAQVAKIEAELQKRSGK